jgi:SAM-dependent methyltransferase
VSGLRALHRLLVAERRREVLAARLAALLPERGRVLDVGCGDGRISQRIGELRPGLEVRGIEVFRRPDAAIPVEVFDGRRLPHPDGAFEAVLFVDVLHHTRDPLTLVREAARVAPGCIVIKDHNLDGWLAGPTLRFMDRVGNPAAGVELRYGYWPRARWQAAFAELGLRVLAWDERLALFPRPADWIFGRSLHFVARLART